MLQGAYGKTTQNIDQQNQNARNGVTPNKLARTVHSAIKVCLSRDLISSSQRVVLTNQTCVKIGVDGHLLAGHCIQGKARRHFRDAARTLGNHHKVNDNKDSEEH